MIPLRPTPVLLAFPKRWTTFPRCVGSWHKRRPISSRQSPKAALGVSSVSPKQFKDNSVLTPKAQYSQTSQNVSPESDGLLPFDIATNEAFPGHHTKPDLSITWPAGTAEFGWFYLRDHCTCSQCRHPDTQQRLVDTFSIPQSVKPVSVNRLDDGLEIKWDESQHQSLYSWAWLRNHVPSLQPGSSGDLRDVQGNVQRLAYFDSTIEKNPPSINYEYIMNSEDGVRDWTALIQKYGFCYIDGCPATPEATVILLQRIAFIRETHYGGFWDFTSDLSSKDMAYTSLALGAHTDTTYFSDPAGLQMFHLLSHTDGSGGESLLVDGYRAFNILKAELEQAGGESLEDLATLTSMTIQGHASGNDDVVLKASGVVCNGDVPADNTALNPFGKLPIIRWNNDDRAVMASTSPKDIASWYRAARKWNDIITRESSEYWSQLQPGRPLIFNNQRVLHGRAVFNGKRRLCGAYINMDDFLSRWRTLNFKREDLLIRN